MLDPDAAATLFIASFNRELASLRCPARVGLPSHDNKHAVLELLDAGGNFLSFVPDAISPQMAAIAYRLYVQGLRRGLQGGEQAAWAKLRHLIGAASDISG